MTSIAEPTMLPAPPDGIQWTARSLTVLDPAMPMERVAELLRALGEVKTATSFHIGDLINFADARYGERYSQVVEATGLVYETISNYAYVCRQVAPSRRRESLRFSHHEAVARFEPAEQDRWLDDAERNRWSRDQLREAIKAAARLEPRTPTETPPPLPERSRGRDLDAPAIVDATRDLNVVHEALRLTHEALEGATVSGLDEKIPEAMRSLDDLGQTVRLAAGRMATPTLRDAAQRLVRAATRSSGFAMIPEDVYEAFRAALAAEGGEG